MQKYLKVFSFLPMLLLCNYVFAQSIESVINFGDSLFRIQQYEVALNEFQRAFFFSDTNRKQQLSTKIAECYMVTGEYEMACSYYDSACYYSVTDNDKTESVFSKIKCYILDEKYGYALLKLNKIDIETNTSFQSKKSIYQGICNFGLANYDQALQLFTEAIGPNDTIRISQLNELFKDRDKLKRPNTAVATVMSIFVPGSGQIYDGKIGAGLNSLILLSSLTFLGIYVPELVVIIPPFLYRYYMGGILHANQFAKERRFEKQSVLCNNLSPIIPEIEYLSTRFNKNENGISYRNYLKDSDSKVILPLLFLGYKKFFSSQDVNACVFEPSCSVYMMEAIKKEGSFIGLLDGLDRLLRCHSFVDEFDYQYNIISERYYDDL